MKKVLLFSLMLGLMVFASCEKDKDKPQDLSVNDAKVELRNVGQQVTTDMAAMTSLEAYTSMNFLMGLLDFELSKQTINAMLVKPGNMTLTKAKTALQPTNKNQKEMGDFGVYAYNFGTGDFDLMEQSTTMLKFIFPSDETALANNQNNASLTVNNLTYQTIIYTEEMWDDDSQTWYTETYEEMVPTNANVDFKISGTTFMTANYNASYTENGFPLATNADVTMAPYSFNMSLSGTGSNYTAIMSFKQNNAEMMGCNLAVIYSADMTDVEKVTGYYSLAPLKVEGWMNYAAINNYMNDIDDNGGTYDLGFLNNQIAMQLMHTELNAKIGDLMFKMYTDIEYNETYPTLAIVYSDGTYEWFEDIMGSENYKFARKR
jgi:hypothetical protein